MCTQYIDVLNWWVNSGLELKYLFDPDCDPDCDPGADDARDEDYDYPLDTASKYNNVNVLDWWFDSGLILQYSDVALRHAINGYHVDVLNWWWDHRDILPLKINFSGIDFRFIFDRSPKTKDWFAERNDYFKIDPNLFEPYDITYDSDSCTDDD